jgi:photosynthetic reaction center cytochrome c subunit
MNQRSTILQRLAALGLAAVLVSLLGGCERPPAHFTQWGYRGTAMADVQNPRTFQARLAANSVPDLVPAGDSSGPKASEVYKNVQVLGDLSAGQFTRVMLAITNWVAPQQGCLYCHDAQGFQLDTNYTKVVARRMLQMTRHLNTDWKDHVKATGVTCYTCHRGQPVPSYVWFKELGPQTAPGSMGNHAGQNAPSPVVGLTSLPFDPFSNYLDRAETIRMASTTALPSGDHQSIKQTEWTYALMIHFSKSLGVNCTYCHNTRSFGNWSESTPQRVTAWYGIRMVRDVNNHYMTPLTPTFPANRKGSTGDVAKVYCTTCHQGVYKPLLGVSMAKDYPELQGPSPDAAPAAVPAVGDPATAPEPAKQPSADLGPARTSSNSLRIAAPASTRFAAN